jgi:hypothetical protein
MSTRYYISSLGGLALLLIAVTLSACAGRSEMRAVASQSGAILNQSQIEASRYAEAQTRYEATAQANIASFSKMTTIGNQQADSLTWVDSAPRRLNVDAKSLSDYQRIVDDATAAPVAPATVTIDTSKVRQAVAKLNELSKKESLDSQIDFLANFAKTAAAAYQDAQKKAAEQATKAASDMKSVSPVLQ